MLVANAAGQTNAQDPTVPPAGQTVLLALAGRGVQIYLCKQTGGIPAWIFVAPEAILEDGGGAAVGSHGAGPVWTLNDGSSVHGKVIAQRVSPVAAAIPWLLLQAVQPTDQGSSQQRRTFAVRRRTVEQRARLPAMQPTSERWTAFLTRLLTRFTASGPSPYWIASRNLAAITTVPSIRLG